MDIMGAVVNAVSGAIGGNASGLAWKDTSLGTMGNTIAGLVGGVAGDYILQAVNLLNNLGLSNMTAGSIATQAGVAAICGAILTAAVGFIKNKMAK